MSIGKVEKHPFQVSTSMRDRLMIRQDDLSPKLRVAAEFIVAHPDEVAMRSLRQVAKAAILTLSRLARALGCETYEELRGICRDELKRRNRILADKTQALLQLSSEGGRVGKSGVFFIQAKSAIKNVQGLIESVDMDKLRTVAEMPSPVPAKLSYAAPRAGWRWSTIFAAWAESMAFDNRRVAGGVGALWATEIANSALEDVVFVVSTRPYGNRPVRAAKIARDVGATVIVITDGFQPPYIGIALNCLIVKTESPQFFPSHAALLVLIEGLMGMIVLRAGKQAADHIQSTELMGFALQEYWEQSNPARSGTE